MVKILILGSTGMLGKALMQEASRYNVEVFGVAKEHAEFCVDIADDHALISLIMHLQPTIIINTVALIDHQLCEKNPGLAYQVNARPASIIAQLARKIQAYVVHISTDHYYHGDGDKKHTEHDPVFFFNEYARTKYAAECFTQTYDNSLIVRTNIVGFRYEKERPTFVEWIVNSFENKAAITLFSDYYTSSLDVRHFSKILFDLIAKRPTGILNVANREVLSKKDFIESFALRCGFDLSNTTSGSVTTLQGAVRADSLGLDISRTEAILGYTLPTKNMVIENLVNEYKQHKG